MAEQERFKIVIVGNASVGKTSIKSTYLGLDYVDNYHMTLGVEIGMKLFGKHQLHLFDIGGQSGFSMAEYFSGAHGAVLVFDVTNRESFDAVGQWVEILSSRIGHMVPAVLVGNKSDLRGFGDVGHISIEEASVKSQVLSQNTIYEIPYFETSAKTGLNIDHLFEFLTASMRTYYH